MGDAFVAWREGSMVDERPALPYDRKGRSMKLGYVTGTFPSHTESFIGREITGLLRAEFGVVVFAARRDTGPHATAPSVPVCYRPPRWSFAALQAVLGLFTVHPRSLIVLPRLLCVLVRAHPREAITLLANLHTLGFFARHLDREAIDHVHACFLSWPACLATALSLITGRTLSISAHARDLFVEQGAAETKVHRASFVCVCTRQGMTRLKALLPTQYHHKLHLVRHGVQCEGVRARKDVDSDGDAFGAPLVLAVGRLIPKKGFDVLLQAFALLAQDLPDVKLCVVGAGTEGATLETLARQLGLTRRVRFLGWQTQDDVRSLMARAAVLVVPSRVDRNGDRDGLPNVVLEAFAGGVPVIASSLAGIREAVLHRRTGLLVRPGDVGGLAAALRETLTDAALRRRLVGEARVLVERKFCPARNVGRLIPLFRSVVACKRDA